MLTIGSNHSPSDWARRRWLVLGATVVVALAAGVAAIAYDASRPESLTDKLSKWIGDPSCLGGKSQVRRASVNDVRRGAPELAPLAKSSYFVSCEHLGPGTLVIEFPSHSDLLLAFASVPRRPPAHRESTARDNWCLTGRSTFAGGGLDKGDLQRICCRLHGSIQRETAPPLPIPLPDDPEVSPVHPPWIRYKARGVPPHKRVIPNACRVIA